MKKKNGENKENLLSKYEFKRNPNLKFLSLIPINETIAEIFVSYYKNKLYIISTKSVYELLDDLNYTKIFSFEEQEGHIFGLQIIKYFLISEKNSEYLITVYEEIILIYDIREDFKRKYKINVDYGYKNDCLLLFSNNIIKNDYIYVSNCGYTITGNYSYLKVYSLDNEFVNMNYLNDLKERVGGESFHLLLWHDKINDKYFIIHITHYGIFIYNLINGKKYFQFENFINNCKYSDHRFYKGNDKGYIYNDKYLVTINYDKINIWDLYQKCLFETINYSMKVKYGGFKNKDFDNSINYLVKWNDKYSITVNKFEVSKYHDGTIFSHIQIIDFEEKKVISKILENKDKTRNIDFVKKINHPIYGESLIVYKEYEDIQLWTTKETAYNTKKNSTNNPKDIKNSINNPKDINIIYLFVFGIIILLFSFFVFDYCQK